MRPPITNILRSLAVAALLLLPVASAQRASTGLVGHWRLNQKRLSGRLFRAESGDRDLKFGAKVLPVFAGEGRGQCLVLTPGFGHLELDLQAHPSSLPAKEITVEAWVTVHRKQRWGGFLGAIEDNGDHERGWLLGFSNDRFTFALTSEGSKRLKYLNSKTVFVPGNWYHVAGTYDGTVQRIFVNGRQEAEMQGHSGGIFYDTVHQFVAGAYKDQDEYFPLVGGLYELRLYDRAVSGEELQRRYERARRLLPEMTIEGAAEPAAPMPQPLSKLQPAINDAIDRGAAYLLRQQHRDGSWAASIGAYRNGATSLATLALLKSGVPADHPGIVQALRFLRRRPPTKTYSMGCQLLALTATGDPKHLPWIQDLADELVLWEGNNTPGRWGYPSGMDLSCTQYAVLGLWTAAMAGAKVPRDTWLRMIDGVQEHQPEPTEVSWSKVPGEGPRTGKRLIAGFSYRTNDVQTGSMTTAGIGILTFAEQALGGRIPRRYRRQLEDSRLQGMGWMDTFYAVDKNPGKGGSQYYYYMYGLERVGALLDVEEIGGRPWYRDGAEVLIKKQGGGGNWGGEVDSSFALLFLSRATSAAHTGPGLSGKSASYSAANGDVHIHATGKSQFTVWIEGFDPKLRKEFEQGEGDGPRGLRVVRVEYLADDEVAHSAEADPRQPWNSQRFAFQHRFSLPGKHHLQARVHVIPLGGDPDFPGELTVLESPLLEIESETSSEEWMRYANVELPGENLLDGFDPLVLASSGEGEKAVDGFESTRWLCDANDEEPWLRIDLPRSVRADTLVLSPAASSIALQGSWDIVRRARVRLNDIELDVVFPENDLLRTVVPLPEEMRVRRIEVRILERFPSRKNRGRAGFSEIELRRTGR
jgi:hypothetical protein